MLEPTKLIKKDGKIMGIYKTTRKGHSDQKHFRAIVTDDNTGVQVLNRQFSATKYGYEEAYNYAIEELVKFLRIHRNSKLYKTLLKGITNYDS